MNYDSLAIASVIGLFLLVAYKLSKKDTEIIIDQPEPETKVILTTIYKRECLEEEKVLRDMCERAESNQLSSMN